MAWYFFGPNHMTSSLDPDSSPQGEREAENICGGVRERVT